MQSSAFATAGIATPGPTSSGPDAADLRAVLNSIGEAVYDWNMLSDRLTWGSNAELILGVPLALISSGQAYADQISACSSTTRHSVIREDGQQDLGSGVPYQAQYGLGGSGDVARLWIEDTGRWFAGPDGRATHAHGVVRVISERSGGQPKRGLSVRIDSLTGIANREALLGRLAQACDLARSPHGGFALLFASIENLVAINRTWGYEVGDEVLVATAERMRKDLRINDMVARHGGNKFALVLDNCEADQMTASARRLIDASGTQPLQTTAGPIMAPLRFGSVAAPRQGRTPHALLQNAGEALDIARQKNSIRYIAFSQSLLRDDARVRTQVISDDIVAALNERRVTLAFQPIVCAKSGGVRFHEALLRLRGRDGRQLPPAIVLPVAEKVGLIQLLDQRVFELALDRLRADPGLVLSVNVSVATAHDPEWPLRIEAALRSGADVASRLTIEMTETCAIEDIDATRRMIGELKRLGLKIAMDDFGAGHTSFRNLRELDIDLLKIDGAFVQNLARSPDDRFFVRTLVELAKFLRIPTVAEWVEDAESVRILADWGVDFLQGHHFGVAEEWPDVDAGRPDSTALQSRL